MANLYEVAVVAEVRRTFNVRMDKPSTPAEVEKRTLQLLKEGFSDPEYPDGDEEITETYAILNRLKAPSERVLSVLVYPIPDNLDPKES
jgi:hypothetical protein